MKVLPNQQLDLPLNVADVKYYKKKTAVWLLVISSQM